MKKYFKPIISSAMALSLVACSSTTDTTPTADAGIYTAGTYVGTASGFGGEVKVEITTDSEKITDVQITGDSETESIGGAALPTLVEQILEAQSNDIEGVTGATVTSDAVKSALAAAIAEAKGEELAVGTVAMQPGTYTSSNWGFSAVRQVPVSVTVDETSIIEITVDTDYAKETGWILQSAIDHIIPRMIENQSYAVDAISGATTSSNAIKAGVRDCLAQALEAGGSDASALEAFNIPTAKVDRTETIDVDIVVVGMGGTGAAAALRAAETQVANGQEVSVLALEKAGTYGGTSASTTSLLAFNSEKTIEAYGEESRTDTQEIVDYLTAQGILGVDNKYAEWYWEDIFDVSGPLVDWMIDHGFYFGEARRGFWGDWRTQFYYNDSQGEDNLTVIHDFFDVMVRDYEELGGEYMTETEGYELIYDEATNTVTGVKARNVVDGTEYVINAKAVIMATGGFGGSSEMMIKYNTGDYWLLGHEQNDGVLIADAIDNLGAGTLGMNASMWGGVHNISTKPMLHTFDYNFAEDGHIDEWRGDIAAWSLNDVPNIIVASPDSIWVTTDGVRAVAEDMMWAWPLAGATYYTIVDQAWLDNIAQNGFSENRVELFCNGGYATFPLNQGIDTLEEGHTLQDVLDACIEQGIAVKADTIEELAAQLNIDSDTLVGTVNTYNESCETGEDALGKAATYLTAMNEGPFYAFTAAPRTYSSIGGLDVNQKLEVVLADGETVINGLYAGGTDSLGATAPAFGGELQVWAYMSGYLAGENAVEYINSAE